MQAMILAAGLGTRLRPLTLHLPKPLFPVLNLPLLCRTVSQLENLGFRKIVINCFHLAHLVLKEMRSYEARANIITLVEPCLLGTGGALRNALPYLSKDEPLLVINGDVVTDLDLARVVDLHQCHGDMATLLVHKRRPWNNLAITDGGVTKFHYRGPDARAFTGISVLDPRLIDSIPGYRPSSLVDLFETAIRQGHYLKALETNIVANSYIWEDIGTLKGYLSAHKALFRYKNNRFLVGTKTELPRDFLWRDWAVIGHGVTLGTGVVLNRSVIWEGSIVPPGKVLKDCIFTPYGKLT